MFRFQSPFPGDDEEEVFDSIVNDEVRYPRFLSLEAIAIMRRVSIATGEPNFAVYARRIYCDFFLVASKKSRTPSRLIGERRRRCEEASVLPAYHLGRFAAAQSEASIRAYYCNCIRFGDRFLDWARLIHFDSFLFRSQNNLEDVSNFDEEFTSEKPHLTPPKEPRHMSLDEQNYFKDFTYVADWC